MTTSRFRRPARSRGRTTARLAVAALLAAAAAALPVPTAQAAGSVVKVTGSQGAWQLTVDGAPYTVKGLTWGPSVADAGQYMPDVKSMGVNTIRTWGTDATTKPLLDTAASHGIKVIAGFWLQPGGGPGSGGCVNYLTDTAYKNDMLAEFPKWVETYKDHEGVLMWNVGNESVLGLQNCYSGDELEQQRDAYTTFVNEIAKKIHAVDPNHPVTSTDAWTGAWPYYKKNAPDLDLYAVNSYDAVCDIRATWESGGYDKPYIVTEGGPAGEWEVPDDANGVPDEPTDVAKAEGYQSAWDCVQGHPGVSLGATLFHYGTEYDFGGVWFNLLPAGQKRLSYYAVKEAYGADTSGDNTPPVISGMTVDNASAVEAGKPFTLRASVSDPDGDALTHQVLVNSKYIDDSGQLTDADFTDRGDDTFEVTAPDRLGVWKVYLKSTDGKGNVGIETKSFKVVPPQVGGVNLASGKPAEASSFQPDSVGCPCPAANAVDGSFDTRWASEWADQQWIQVDLGATASFDHVQLAWEAAYAKAYTIQTSDNGQDWNTVHTETAGNGGIDDVEVAGNARYVRVNATERGTPWGYSLYEFGVYRS
ncbi:MULTISPECIES: discoidin domain-containing protein [Streptomyces]|uniref:discoidin domain-containing protein n=1 Tax=Streptomyces TaxID=1883 RepID=UPI001C4F2E22|nr:MULTISPECIES: discoidin domain-containing protein [Streptomyces]MCX4713127.1 discoidin domain-containing protein [Streptomyces griseus]QXR00741.1 discoidin domain-containing protein [Streptomyces sp. WY228]